MAFNALARLPNSSVGPDVCSKTNNDTDKNDMLSHHPSCQDPASMTLNVDDLYSSQTPEKSHHSCLLPKIKEAKELQGIMLSDSDLYCSGVDPGPIDVGNSVNSVSMSSSMMVMMNTASSSGNDYSMLSNFDSSLSHVNNMNILSLPNIFHTSETDSEVALTLASLGDPKNEKLEQSAAVVENFAGDNIEKTLSNGLNDNISSLNSNATESCISNTVNNQTFQKKDYFSSASENVIHKSILSSDQMSSDKVSSVEPTLVLRSRRARGSACSNQQRQHNFPDPERISRKRRKKDASSKHTLEKIPLQVTDVISKNTGATPHVLHTSSSQMGDTLIEDTHLYCQLQNQLPTSKDSSSTLNSTEKLYFLGKEFSFSESQLSPLEAANDQKQLHNLNKEPRSDDLSSLQSSKSTAEPSSVCVDSNVEDSHLDTFSNVMLAANSILDGHFSSQKTVESVNIYNQDGRVFQRYHPNSSGIHSSANSTQVLPSSVFSLPSSTTLIHPTVAPCYAVNCSVEQNSDFTTSNDVRISAVQCPMGTTDINVFASNKNEFASSLNTYPHTSVSQTPQSFPLISSTFTSTSNSFTSLNSLVPSSNNLGENKLGGDHFFSLQSSDFQGPNCLQSSGSAQSVPTVTQSFSNSSTSYLPGAQTQNTFSHTLYESNTSAADETLPQVEQGASKSASCSYSNAINGEATLQNSSNTGKNEQAQVISNSREKVIGESGGLATVLLLPVTSAGISEKENLLGQLLKASEHCEPASLIPAGVVNDVIPAVGYRILEVSNLSEMMRSMHCCSGSSVPGTIVIQEQASLREGAVSQLSVICTACQEGTVCATSNRVASDGSASAAPGSAWDINLRVQQLAQEFGLTEHQVQRMLEILGIFYRPCDPATIADPRSSGNADSSLRCEVVPAGNADISAPITEQNTDGVTLTSRRTASNKTAELKFESLQNLSVSNNNTNSNGGACTKTSKKKTKKNKKSSPAEPKPKTISCTECPAKFAALNHLKKHALSHNLAQHTCPYCHSYFKKPYNLREHIKKHQNVKYTCEICQREFTDRSSLTVHRKSAHERKKEFVCTECPRSFYRRIHFRDHMRMHTRERPYSCEVCHKRFIWRDSVKKHMETHITAAKYSCRLCGKWFRWLQGIRQHLQQQHKLKKCDVEAQVLNGGPSALFQKHPQDQFFHNDPSRTITADPSDTAAVHTLHQQHPNSAVEASNHPGILIRLEDDLSIANNSGEYICGEKQNEVQEAVRSIQILEPQSSPPASHEILHGVSDQSEALPNQPGERLDVEAIYLVENEESHPNNTTLLDENPRESTDKSDLNRPLRSLQSIEQDQSRDYDNLILDAQTGSANSKEWRPRYFVHENSTCNVESSSSNTNQREGNVSSNVITTESQNSSMLPCNVIYDNVQRRTSSNNPDIIS